MNELSRYLMSTTEKKKEKRIKVKTLMTMTNGHTHTYIDNEDRRFNL